MNWDLLFIVLMSVGAIQGIVLGILLLRTTQTHAYANRILAILLFFLAYQLVAEILAAGGAIHTQTFLYHLFLEYNWVYGALVFFYVTSILDTKWRFGRKDWLHLVPLILEFCISNFVKAQNLFWDGTRESLSWLGLWGYVLWEQTPVQEVVGASLVIGYSWVALNKMARYVDQYPGFKKKSDWIRIMLRLYIVASLIVAAWSLIDFIFFDYAFNPSYIYPSYISISILTYVLGLLGFIHRNDSFAIRVGRQGNTDGEWHHIVASFEEVVRDQELYKNPGLSLAEVAALIEVKPYLLTEAINSIKGVSFKEYVNSCRVEEVMRLMQDPDYQQYTLTAIAFEAGFNSKATFNRIFKKMTGKSPSEAKKEVALLSSK